MTMLRTRQGLQKHRKIAGDGRGVDWIPTNRVKPFKVLFDSVRSKVGTYHGAMEYIGLSSNTVDGLEKSKISAVTGRKIFDAYNRLKSEDSARHCPRH